MLEWRLKAYRHWLTMRSRSWANVTVPADRLPGDHLLRAPKPKTGPKSLDEVDPELLAHLREARHPAARAARCWPAWRSTRCSTASRWRPPSRRSSAEAGIIFCSFSEAVHEHPELVREYLGTVVPPNDNFFAALNSAVFSDGSFVYIPKGVRCPMELSTYFRINAKNTGQFERTLIIAEEGAYVSYLEGCTAPMRDENQLHAAVVELVRARRRHHQVLDGAELVPRRRRGQGRHLQLRHQARPSAPATARRSPGPRWRPARPSPGSTRASSCRATTRSASSTRWR